VDEEYKQILQALLVGQVVVVVVVVDQGLGVLARRVKAILVETV
jgi:hypothetical protein